MLRFYIGRIPVGIHFTFLFVLWIAYSYFNDLTQAGLAGIGILVGIVVHELGHALTARRFGATKVSITLFALGGVTTYPPPPGLTAGRRFLTAAAGSALAFAVGVPVFLVREPLLDSRTLEPIVIGFLIATLFWGVLNWVPIRPLDGGQMLTSALQIFFPHRGAAAAKVISVIFTAGAVYWLYTTGQEFAAIYVALIGFVGLRDDPEIPEAQPERGEQAPVEREREAPPEFPL